MSALIIVVFVALACDGDANETVTEEERRRSEQTETERSTPEPDVGFEDEEPEEQLEEEPELAPEPPEAAPERVRFRPGATEGTVRFTLAPNETKRYVIGVAPAQYLHIGMDDETPVLSIPNRSRISEVNEGESFIDGVTLSTGDIVFEISNPTQRSVRTFAIVTIKDREPMDH
ncbi:MAG: hypothetical protein DWQ47_10595 [Acidobacteria bacterium]|nr:MAG: hypothetical protein DWQ32_13010 [Acidobacteriota bacterium]REJ98034.1 MAG: hypothetical protein DWQ38_15810 [Acidobacteriota bacterium]REK16777.1 MAG: hypothetical protein DWQ43_00855 [Acidobacteriota bacterium]REK42688.1 MAG: hypothetical protein DWQ47_10595 [Acidobacteriota bacterium]